MRTLSIQGTLRAPFRKLGLLGCAPGFLHLAVEFRLLRLDIGWTHGPDLRGRVLLVGNGLAMATSPEREEAEHQEAERHAHPLDTGDRDRSLSCLVALPESR